MSPHYCECFCFFSVTFVHGNLVSFLQISPYSLLPDTICGKCLENVDNFYSFIKNCLQNIIILEAHYDITESCLKTKRKHDKGCLTDVKMKQENFCQTDDLLDLLIKENDFQYNLPPLDLIKPRIVDYDIDSDTNSENSDFPLKKTRPLDSFVSINSDFGKKYFDDAENYLINEIAQRKNKRKNDDLIIESSRPKMLKLDANSNRRKSKQPKKVSQQQQIVKKNEQHEIINNPTLNESTNVFELTNGVAPFIDGGNGLLQVCLLCDEQFPGPSMLASHIFEAHGIDMAQIVAVASDNNVDKKKKLPNLLKISDLRKSDSLGEFWIFIIKIM